AALLVTVWIAIFLLVVMRMEGMVRRHEQAEERERALREAGAAFVAATTRGDLYFAATLATRELAGGGAAIRLYVRSAPGDPMDLVAEAGKRAPADEPAPVAV